MLQGPMAYRALRKTMFLLGTGAFALGVGSSCDPTVRTTVLSGFQGLATSLVTAVFQNIAIDDSGTTGTTTTNNSTTGS